jgi:hypothetical protein
LGRFRFEHRRIFAGRFRPYTFDLGICK